LWSGIETRVFNHLFARGRLSLQQETSSFPSRVFPAGPSLCHPRAQARSGLVPLPRRSCSLAFSLLVYTCILSSTAAIDLLTTHSSRLRLGTQDYAGAEGRDSRQKGETCRAQAPARTAPERVQPKQSQHWRIGGNEQTPILSLGMLLNPSSFALRLFHPCRVEQTAEQNSIA